MTPAVEYSTFQKELRVNGLVFTQVWIAVYQFQSARRYALLIEDPVFGRFELTSNMVVEWKLSGRWYQTTPSLVLDQLLSKGEVYAKKSRRSRTDDGRGD